MKFFIVMSLSVPPIRCSPVQMLTLLETFRLFCLTLCSLTCYKNVYSTRHACVKRDNIIRGQSRKVTVFFKFSEICGKHLRCIQVTCFSDLKHLNSSCYFLCFCSVFCIRLFKFTFEIKMKSKSKAYCSCLHSLPPVSNNESVTRAPVTTVYSKMLIFIPLLFFSF